jgi:hypothetical protein
MRAIAKSGISKNQILVWIVDQYAIACVAPISILSFLVSQLTRVRHAGDALGTIPKG